jgi:hypothetical protein
LGGGGGATVLGATGFGVVVFVAFGGMGGAGGAGGAGMSALVPTEGSVEVVGVEVDVLVPALKGVAGAEITGTAGVVGVVPQAVAMVSAAITQTIRLVTIFVSVPPTGSSYVTVRI